MPIVRWKMHMPVKMKGCFLLQPNRSSACLLDMIPSEYSDWSEMAQNTASACASDLNANH